MARRKEPMALGGVASVRPPSRERATTATQEEGKEDDRFRLSLRLPKRLRAQLTAVKVRRQEQGCPQNQYSFDAIVREAIDAYIKEGQS